MAWHAQTDSYREERIEGLIEVCLGYVSFWFYSLLSIFITRAVTVYTYLCLLNLNTRGGMTQAVSSLSFFPIRCFEF